MEKAEKIKDTNKEGFELKTSGIPDMKHNHYTIWAAHCLHNKLNMTFSFELRQTGSTI